MSDDDPGIVQFSRGNELASAMLQRVHLNCTGLVSCNKDSVSPLQWRCLLFPVSMQGHMQNCCLMWLERCAKEPSHALRAYMFHAYVLLRQAMTAGDIEAPISATVSIHNIDGQFDQAACMSVSSNRVGACM